MRRCWPSLRGDGNLRLVAQYGVKMIRGGLDLMRGTIMPDKKKPAKKASASEPRGGESRGGESRGGESRGGESRGGESRGEPDGTR